MGRAACCRDHEGQRRGPWTPEEDQKLIHYLQRHGLSNWRTLPKLAGLSRCGKSCRVRWTNYLRPDIKHGTFTIHEDLTVIHLHAILGNKWSAIASHLPGRTDNEIKNRWNTKLKKQLLLMGIDPVTHGSVPTPDYTYSFVASSLTVKSSIAAGCNTARDYGFPNEINQGFDSRQNDPIDYNAFLQEALQFSSLERKQEGMADMISNLKSKTDVFPDGLPSDEEIKYDESRHSHKGGISEILENAIQYHQDDPFGSLIITADLPAARADLLNKGDELNYLYNLLNLMENGMPGSS